MPVPTYTKNGTKAVGSVTLPKSIFSEEVKSHDLIHQSFVAQHAALRANSATALMRGEVRGGGRKPWKQKGTGRARHGSIRSPIWRGGGVTFGPNNERAYEKKINIAGKRKALRQVLTLSATDGSLSVIDSVEARDGRTKTVALLLKKLALPMPLLLVVEKKSVELERSTRNIEGLRVVTARYLSVYRVSNAAHILITKPALSELETWLNPKKVVAVKKERQDA